MQVRDERRETKKEGGSERPVSRSKMHHSEERKTCFSSDISCAYFQAATTILSGESSLFSSTAILSFQRERVVVNNSFFFHSTMHEASVYAMKDAQVSSNLLEKTRTQKLQTRGSLSLTSVILGALWLLLSILVT